MSGLDSSMQVIYQRAQKMWGVYLVVLLIVSLVGGGGWAAVSSYLGIDKALEMGQIVMLTWPLILGVAIVPLLVYGLKGSSWPAITVVLVGAMWIGDACSGASLEPGRLPYSSGPDNIATLPFRVLLGFLNAYGPANLVGAVLIGLVTPFAAYFVVKGIRRDPPVGPGLENDPRFDKDAVWQRWIAEEAPTDGDNPAASTPHRDSATHDEEPPRQ